MRLITRADLDGLTSSVFITQKEQVEEIAFAHPKDMQDGRVHVEQGDIICNLPYHPSCSLWFDHHESEERAAKVAHYTGLYGVAPSAARLVFQHYDDRNFDKYGEMLAETDRVDSARLGVEDVLHPTRWVLLGITLDPRSGMGAFQAYFRQLVEAAKTDKIEQIMEIPEVNARIEQYFVEQERFEAVTRESSYLDRNVIVTDFRELDTRPIGNRFLIYTVYPQGNISVQLFWGRGRKNIVAAVGHSIFNRSCKTHVGNLLAEYGGGGLRGAGTAQFAVDEADAKIKEIITRIQTSA